MVFIKRDMLAVLSLLRRLWPIVPWQLALSALTPEVFYVDVKKSDCNCLYSDLIVLGSSTSYGSSLRISFSESGILVGADIISNTVDT